MLNDLHIKTQSEFQKQLNFYFATFSDAQRNENINKTQARKSEENLTQEKNKVGKSSKNKRSRKM